MNLIKYEFRVWFYSSLLKKEGSECPPNLEWKKQV